MKIIVNGKAVEIDHKSGIPEVLKASNVKDPQMVSLQLNGEFVDQKSYNDIKLEENDELDFLYFMGGGQTYNAQGKKSPHKYE